MFGDFIKPRKGPREENWFGEQTSESEVPREQPHCSAQLPVLSVHPRAFHPLLWLGFNTLIC